VSLHSKRKFGVIFLKNENTIYFEDLPYQVQEIIIELIASVIENKNKNNEED